MWIKRLKTECGEYDVKVDENPIYRKGIFIVKICTPKNHWWVIRDAIKEFITEDDPLTVAGRVIDELEESEQNYFKALKRLNDECGKSK